MGDGIPVGSLALIEGSSGAGKSVLTQQIIRGSLQDGFLVTLFTTENSVKSLVSQMQSIDLDILDYLLLGKLKVYPVELSRLGRQAPFALLDAMKHQSKRDMIVVDSIGCHSQDGRFGCGGLLRNASASADKARRS
jgi:flagellar protein FlaH